MNDEHDINHAVNIRGFSIETLNTMVYNSNLPSEIDDDNDVNLANYNNVNCNYVHPKDLQYVTTGINIMSHNIRSMQTNFVNFSAELLDKVPVHDIIGLCETHLTDSTTKLYNRHRKEKAISSNSESTK